MSLRRLPAAVSVGLLTSALLGGCGGATSTTHDPSSTPTPSTSSTSDPVDPGPPSDTALQQPRAAETIEPKATLTAVPGASELPAPAGAPRTIQGFPVPDGVRVKDPGALDQTWQFDIHANNLDRVIAFYKRVLPQMGWRVRTDVTYTLGDEAVRWDVVFDGRVSGSMVRDPANGVVFVVVNHPGQPAIAGESAPPQG